MATRNKPKRKYVKHKGPNNPLKNARMLVLLCAVSQSKPGYGGGGLNPDEIRDFVGKAGMEVLTWAAEGRNLRRLRKAGLVTLTVLNDGTRYYEATDAGKGIASTFREALAETTPQGAY